MEVKKGWSVTGTTLKWIAVVTMLIDHIGMVILDNSNYVTGYPSYQCVRVFRGIGRIAFPLFILCLVEGFEHTKNRMKYLRNLVIFALISEVPFNLAKSGKVFDLADQSVMLTLILGFIAMMCMEWAGKRDFEETLELKTFVYCFLFGVLGTVLFLKRHFKYRLADFFEGKMPLYIILASVAVMLILTYGNRNMGWWMVNRVALMLACCIPAAALAEALGTDYGGFGVLTVVGTYLYRRDKLKAFLMGCLILIVKTDFEVCALFGLIPVAKYNGERGRGMKYFFYVFYPAHLLVLYLIAHFALNVL